MAESGPGTHSAARNPEAADANGIHRFRADVLAENRRMLRLLATESEIQDRKTEAGVDHSSCLLRAVPVLAERQGTLPHSPPVPDLETGYCLYLMERTDFEQWKAKEVARLLALVETERRYYQEMVAVLPVPWWFCRPTGHDYLGQPGFSPDFRRAHGRSATEDHRADSAVPADCRKESATYTFTAPRIP